MAEAASLVGAQLELKAMDEQAERLARAELRALRAQISPHFIYNALAAIAGYIHSNPEEARELLTEFAEFTRYAFRGQRPYVTLADELYYVEKYLRLERARFGERLQVRLEVAPEVLQAVVPCSRCSRWWRTPCATASSSAARAGSRSSAAHIDADVELRVIDDGVGMDPERAADRARRNGGGVGIANVQARLQIELRARLRARDRQRPGRGYDGDDDAAEVPRRGAGGMIRVLAVVDDERPALEDLGRLLETSPSVEDVVLADGGAEALRVLADERFDVVFLDVRMPGHRRARAGKAARPLRRSARAGVRLGVRGRCRVGAFEHDLHPLDYLMKPVSRARVEQALSRVVDGREPPSAVASGPTSPEPSDRRDDR